MNDLGLITMSLREADRFKVIQATAEGLLPQWRAAERLDLTTRQVRRLVQRWRMDGPRALIQAHYADFGPTLACEKLRERHGWRRLERRSSAEAEATA